MIEMKFLYMSQKILINKTERMESCSNSGFVETKTLGDKRKPMQQHHLFQKTEDIMSHFLHFFVF